MPSLYLHIPFCEKKCLYCDFTSVEGYGSMDLFLVGLGREIALSRPWGKDQEFDTVFFGGGTPSLLTPKQLEVAFSFLHEAFEIRPGAEITLETNPGTVDREKLLAFRSIGINRLSIGIQSFHDDELAFLGRIHNATEAARCIMLARDAGFSNVSIDLICSLPGQTLQRWAENLRKAVGMDPDHISAYSLIVEEQTPLARLVHAGTVIPNPMENEAEMYEFTMEFLAARGFDHYEVSNYARPGYRCRHNCAYWSHDNYLGFGPSAHSFWVLPGALSARRWWNIPSVSTYSERLLAGKSPVAAEESVSQRELINERIFLGLRSDGLDTARVERDFRFEFLQRQRDLMAQLVREQLAVVDGSTLRLTQRGYLLCDEISGRLFL